MNIEESVPLSKHTTFKTGGVARYMATVATEAELREVCAYAKEMDLPILVLAGGSNVLISDDGFPGLVVKMEMGGQTAEVNGEVVEITVGAGEELDQVIGWTVDEGWWGLENLSAIPGSVGAAPIQNVGAYGVEAGDRLTRVRVFDVMKGEFCELTPGDCRLGYRDSVFKHSDGKALIVTSVTFDLSTRPDPRLGYKDLMAAFAGGTPTQREIRQAVIDIRSKKFPDWRKTGTAGSFFKNPFVSRGKFEELAAHYPDLPHYEVNEEHVKLPLGWILDKLCGLKGSCEGAVCCYEHQALVIVNRGGATTSDIKRFAASVAASVKRKTGIDIENEVTYVR